MITRSLYKAIRLGEVYCDEPVGLEPVDIVRFNQSLNPIPKSRYEQFFTRIIDLSLSEDALFANIKKDTRNEIRRAAREQAAFEVWRQPGRDLLARFIAAYDVFASEKGLPSANRARLDACLQLNRLVVSRAQFPNSTAVWHAYYCTSSRARLLHSAQSHAPTKDGRNVAGRLNRFLHWSDLCFFRNNAFETYDLGGWYSGADDRKRLAINAFKSEFGGTVAEEYNCLLGITPLGRVLCTLHSLTNRNIRVAQAAN